jgi:hypothetical protein
VLGIPDQYERNQPELIALLKEKGKGAAAVESAGVLILCKRGLTPTLR